MSATPTLTAHRVESKRRHKMAEILIDTANIISATKYKSGKVCLWVNRIVEVPTHGDLVDRDFIKHNGLSLNDAPIVVPASKE